jgi:LysM repeat protein
MRSIHQVKPGENINTIANYYGVGVGDLIRRNNHAVGSAGIVHPGMRLEIP